MTVEPDYRRVLQAYPPECQPLRVEYLAGAGGFSGARFWKLVAPCGALCLRRWPSEHPNRQRLEFIQAVLWHVRQEGFQRAPLPLETRTRAGYVCEAGHFWELTPWRPGEADYRRLPSPEKLRAALAALAEFHRAAASFPLPDAGPAMAPALSERLQNVERCSPERLRRLTDAVAPRDWPELALRARQWLAVAPAAALRVRPKLAHAATLLSPLQPCIRDIWHDHVLFVGSEVSAIVDFGAMRADSVAGDVARLLGSLAGDDLGGWEIGLRAYEQFRSLSDSERALVDVFDQANTLLTGLNWLEWIYLEGREFENRAGVLERLDWNLPRLARLAG